MNWLTHEWNEIQSIHNDLLQLTLHSGDLTYKSNFLLHSTYVKDPCFLATLHLFVSYHSDDELTGRSARKYLFRHTSTSNCVKYTKSHISDDTKQTLLTLYAIMD